MKPLSTAIGIIISAIVITTGAFFGTPILLDNRLSLRASVNGVSLAGMTPEAARGQIDTYNDWLRQQEVVLILGEKTVKTKISKLGIAIDVDKTAAKLSAQDIEPELKTDPGTLQAYIHSQFQREINPPVDAQLTISANGEIVQTPSQDGQGIDIVSFHRDVLNRVRRHEWQNPIALQVINQAAEIQDYETEQAKTMAEHLLANGILLQWQEKNWRIAGPALIPTIVFQKHGDPGDPNNKILVTVLDEQSVSHYLEANIAPVINQPAQNARFELASEDGQVKRVDQFSLPEPGLTLDIKKSVAEITSSPVTSEPINLVVHETQPDIANINNITELGITTLLATGQTDFKGSPANRRHNIGVGTSRYQGLLIAPGEEFSFNEFLGPVTASAGYKPELVIKGNKTTPEYGGGLCQVSTTMFRAAALAGLEIAERKAHSYHVVYYGEPGFDATIYPGHTDFRFINNTPGHILIQSRLEGTQLAFELWGTDDGREVVIDGPHPYNRAANGAVKATLNRKVVKNGEVIIDETFHSNYKSPKLYPKVSGARDSNNTTSQAPEASLDAGPI